MKCVVNGFISLVVNLLNNNLRYYVKSKILTGYVPSVLMMNAQNVKKSFDLTNEFRAQTVMINIIFAAADLILKLLKKLTLNSGFVLSVVTVFFHLTL